MSHSSIFNHQLDEHRQTHSKAQRLGYQRALQKQRDPAVLFAAFTIIRALRRAGLHTMLYGGSGTVGFIVPHAQDLEIFQSAGDVLLRAHKSKNFERDYQAITIDNKNKRLPRTQSDRKSSWDDTAADLALAMYRRNFLFASGTTKIPSFLKLAADAIIPLETCNEHILCAGLHALFHQKPSPQALPIVDGLPISILAAALRSRPSLSQAITLLRRITQELNEPAATPERTLKAGSSLDDLPGMGAAGDWGRSMALDLRAYRDGEIPWAEVDRGIVVCGSPGVGKNMFASALARSCNAPLHTHSLARWQARGHLGDLLKAMRKAFADAKADAPCIMFIDEIDAIGDRARLDERNEHYCREVINGFLECLDGTEGREGVIVVGATNFPDKIDPAILRPGRLERVIAIPLPDTPTRARILRYHLGGHLPEIDLIPFSRRLEGLTGADLEKIARDAKRAARRSKRAMTLDDLRAVGPDLVKLPPNVYRQTCLHEAGHALVGCLVLEETSNMPFLVRVRREMLPGRSAGETLFARSSFMPQTRTFYLGDITIMLAGLVAEELVLGEHSNGCGGQPGSDLHRATLQALTLEVSTGMGRNLVYRGGFEEPTLLDLIHGDPELRNRVEETLQTCRIRAKTLLTRHRAALDALTLRLEQEGELEFREIAEVLHAHTPGRTSSFVALKPSKTRKQRQKRAAKNGMESPTPKATPSKNRHEDVHDTVA